MTATATVAVAMVIVQRSKGRTKRPVVGNLGDRSKPYNIQLVPKKRNLNHAESIEEERLTVSLIQGIHTTLAHLAVSALLALLTIQRTPSVLLGKMKLVSDGSACLEKRPY